MVETAPANKEISDFKFKLFTRLKIFSGHEEFLLNRPNKLVAVSSKYGIIFVGTPTGIQCIRSEDLSPQDERLSNRNVTNYKRREIQLGAQPTHLDVSCDNEYLAITLFLQDCAVLQIYSIKSCISVSVQKVSQVQLSSTPGVNVLDLQWNPGVPNMIAVAMADGSAAVIEFKDGSFNINSIPQNAQASCLCWSPKGKQVVIGAKNGSLTQYKPELKAVKTFPAPQMGFPLSVISVHWLSNFQFIAVYKNMSDPSSKSHVVVVNVPKNVPPRYVYYEDLCFESDTSRPEHYFIHQQMWNVLFVGTTNSMEASVLKLEGENWVQYLQGEESRAELPLTDDHKDVFNMGIAMDTSSSRPVVIGDKFQTGPMPILLMYAHNGVLCLYHVINTLPGTPSICQSPEQLQDTSGLHLFTPPTESASAVKQESLTKPEPSKPKDAISPEQNQQASPGMGLSQLGFKGAVSSPQSSVQLPQVSSSTFSGFGIPTSGGSDQAGGLAKTNIFPQISFGQTSPARPAVSQPQSLFGQSGFSQASPASTVPTSAQHMQKPSFSLPQTAQNEPISQPQTMPVHLQTQPLTSLQPQVQSSLIQHSAEVKPASTTAASWQSSGFQLPQSQSSTLSNQSQTTVTSKALSSPSGFSMQSVRDGSSSSYPSSNSVITTVPAVSQEAPYIEEPEEKDTSKDMKLAMSQCQELIMKFNKEMEERQRTIKKIVTRTDQNIQKSCIKEKLIRDIEILRKFEDKLAEYNSPDQEKVNSIGSSLMEMFGWYEKIIARERMTKNSSYIELMESQELDPVTKNYLKSIDKHFYYLESQIKQAKAKLGTLWDNMESTMDIPVMEAIYQSLVAQHSILAAKKNLIETYENKLKKINHSRLKRNNRNRVRDLELSTLADRLLTTKLGDSDVLRDSSLTETANKYLLLANKTGKWKLSEEKVGALYEWHKNHKVIKTKISNSSAIVQTNFLKDTSFNGMLSPSKQSTPYVTTNGTPKKAISSAPRKSLFTLTTLDDETTIAEPSNQVTDISTTPQQSGESVAQISLIENNLSSNFAKASEGNKIDGIKDLTTQPTSVPSDNSDFTSQVSSAHAGFGATESIPTPAAFKGFSEPQKTNLTKPESVISTSWGAQAPVFGSSPLFSSISKSPASSTSVYPLTGGSPVQSSSTSNNSVFKTSTTTGSSTASQPLKSMFSFPTTTTTQSLFSGSPKGSTPISNSSAEVQNKTSPTTSAPTYIPTPLKSMDQSPNASFNFSGSTTNALTFATLNFGASTQPSNTQSDNVVFSNTKPVTSLSDPNSLNSNTIFSAVPNSFQSSGSISSSTSSTSSSLTITPVIKTTSSTIPITVSQPGVASATIPSTSTPNLTSSSGILTTTSLSQQNIVPTTASQPSQPMSSGVSTPPKSISSSGTTGSIFGGLAGSFTFGSTTGSIFGNSSEPSSVIFGAATSSSPSTFSAPTNAGTSDVTSTTVSSSVSSSSLAQPSTAVASTTKTTVSITSSSPQPQSSLAPGSSPPSLFVNTATTTSVTTASSTTSTTIATSTTSPSIFGSSGSPSVITTTSTSIFGGSPIFGASFKSSSSTTQPFFSNTPSFGATTTTSIFGSSATSTTAVFGNSSKTSSVFGGATTTTATVFGSPTTTTTATGFTSSTATTNTTVFGSPSTTTATSTIFGSPTTTATTSVFGSTVASTTASVFGSGATNTTTAAVFGTPATTTISSSVFGTTASSTTATGTIFGSPATTTATKTFFGPTSTTASSIFGSSSAFGATTQGNSLFGAANALSSTSFFGSATTTSSQTFGSPSAASIFGGASSFGATATTSSSSASFFGKPICSPTSSAPNVFGSGGNVFGQSATTTASSIFGGSGSFQQKSPFGQSGSLFGQTTSSGGTFGSSGGSLFGGTASFSNPTSQQGNIFQSGASGGSIFGGGSPGGPFSSPQTGQATFGAPPSFQTPQRPFGNSAPGFGSSPSFGSPPTFGGAPAFGGSPNKVFGSPSGAAAPTFGSPSQQSTNTFETLAQQETLSFGNLAQPQQQQTFPTTSFAGSSFSSWRR